MKVNAPSFESQASLSCRLSATSSSLFTLRDAVLRRAEGGHLGKWTCYSQGQGHRVRPPMEGDCAEGVAQSVESLPSMKEA